MTATVTRAVVFEVLCPHCGESVESPEGSLLWLPQNILGAVPDGKTRAEIVCQSCGMTLQFNVPKAAK